MRLKLDNVRLNEVVRREINAILNEELSIANEVKNTSDDLTKMFMKGQRKFKYNFFSLGEFNVFGKPVEINNNHSEAIGYTDFRNYEVLFEIPIVNGTLDEALLSRTIFHEVEHIYQTYKRGTTDTSYDKVYDIARTVITNTDGKIISSESKRLAYYVYCCSNIEQDAFVNELYSDLMKNNKDITYIIRKSSAYKALYLIRTVNSELLDSMLMAYYKQAIDEYQKSKKWFVNLGKTAEMRLTSKMNNVIRKAEKDKMKTTTFRPKMDFNFEEL